MRTRQLFPLALLFLLCFISEAKEPDRYYFRHLKVEDGLPSNQVSVIMKDDMGYMWLGTKKGLVRYDGSNMRIYTQPELRIKGRQDNYIKDLYQDPLGMIWIASDAAMYQYDPMMDTYTKFSMKAADGVNMDGEVTSILGNGDEIWVTVSSKGLFKYQIHDKTLVHYGYSDYFNETMSFQNVVIDRNGTFWIGDFGKGLLYSDDELRTIKPYLCPEDGSQPFKGDMVQALKIAQNDCLYVGSLLNGVREINITSKKMRDIVTTNDNGTPIQCRDIEVTRDDILLAGTESGLFRYSLRTESLVNMKSNNYDEYSLSDNAIYDIYFDDKDGIWVGSFFGGVDYTFPEMSNFQKYYPCTADGGLEARRIAVVKEDSQGRIWVGSSDNGLFCLNPQTGKFASYDIAPGFSNIQTICEVHGLLWVGSYANGIRIIDPSNGKVIRSFIKKDDGSELRDNSIFSIAETKDGKVLIATYFGIQIYDFKTDSFSILNEVDGCFIQKLFVDSKGNVWAGAYTDGIWFWDSTLNIWQRLLSSPDDTNSIPDDHIADIFEDEEHIIWIATSGGGICKYDPENRSLVTYDELSGFPNNNISAIGGLPDGHLWITSQSGLIDFNKAGENCSVYTVNDGLLSIHFSSKAISATRDGIIFIGTKEGLISFNPSEMRQHKRESNLHWTDMSLLGIPVRIGVDDSPLTKSLEYTGKIKLSYNQNSFGFKISTLDYMQPEDNPIEYRLKGLSKDWQLLDDKTGVSFSHVPPGHYTLEARFANADQASSSASKEIHIKRPFYASFPAYLSYIFLIALFILVYLRYRDRTMEIKKERELFQDKLNFFTHVAHEIRTPLTLINGPLEEIIRKAGQDDDTRNDLSIMKKNTDHLLDLTNQLLDYRRLTDTDMNLSFQKYDVTELLKSICSDFSTGFRTSGIQFSLILPEEGVFAEINVEAVSKIISNLMSNALKYANSRFSIEMKAVGDRLIVRAENDGSRIPESMREQIFKPFVRINEEDGELSKIGTGIGLVYSRALAEKHGGSLRVDENSVDTAFILDIPLSHGNMAGTPSVEAAENTDNSPAILLVEDNHDVIEFEEKVLSGAYLVLRAGNGQEALEILGNKAVSLIVSDIMMPVMNGLELCREVKENIKFSHIPVVLLTAKTSLESKIEGLELGADAYIEKPFSVDYLKACIRSILKNREKAFLKFAQSPFAEFGTVTISPKDDEFLKKIHALITERLSDPEFSLEDIERDMNMSHSSFYRKVKGTVGLAPNEFLRLERLKKAAELLKDGRHSISEVSYMVGFNSPSYFTKCFQKQFGKLPKDYSTIE